MNCGLATDILDKFRGLVTSFGDFSNRDKIAEFLVLKQNLIDLRLEFIDNLAGEKRAMFERIEIARKYGYSFVSPFNDAGIAVVRSEDEYKVIRRDGTEPDDQSWITGYFGLSENHFCVSRGPGQTLFARNYFFIRSADQDSAAFATPASFSEGLAAIKILGDNGKYYYLNEEDELEGALGDFVWADNFHEGLACVAYSDGYEYFMIDKNGFKFDKIPPLRKKAQCGSSMINVNVGLTVGSTETDEVEIIPSAYYVDRNGEEIASPKNDFAEARPFRDGRAFVKYKDKEGWYLIDDKFDKVSPFPFEDVHDETFHGGFAMVRRNEKDMVINQDCQVVLYVRPGDDDGYVIDDLLHIIRDGKEMWLTNKGRRVKFA